MLLAYMKKHPLRIVLSLFVLAVVGYFVYEYIMDYEDHEQNSMSPAANQYHYESQMKNSAYAKSRGDPSTAQQQYYESVDHMGRQIWIPKVKSNASDLLGDRFREAVKATIPKINGNLVKRLTTPELFRDERFLLWGTPGHLLDGGPPPNTRGLCGGSGDALHKGYICTDQCY